MYCPKCGVTVTGAEHSCKEYGIPIIQSPANEQQVHPITPNMQPPHQVYQSMPQKPKTMFSDPNIPSYEKGQIIVVFALGLLATFMLFSSGLSMSEIVSKGGRTMEEVFYKYMGQSLMGMSAMVLASTIYFWVKMTNKYKGRYTR